MSVIVQAITGALILGVVYALLTGNRPYAGIPLVDLDRKGLSAWLPAKFSFMQKPKELLSKGSHENASCFQVAAGVGYKIIVPNRFAEELKNNPNLDFQKATLHDFFPGYSGFEGITTIMSPDNIVFNAVRTKLTQSLGLVTDDLVQETTDSLHDILGESLEWNITSIKQDVLNIVARLSSRVFLGKDLARNEEWLEICKNYTVDAVSSQVVLHLFPKLLQPLVHRVLPVTRRLRAEVRDARRLIDPEVQLRQKRAEEAIRAGSKPPKTNDAIGWMVEMAKGRPFDYVAGQLGLSLVAIHTTSEALTQALVQLCATPEVVQPLREEVVKVLKAGGWVKTSLYKMKIMDSFLKEVQRMQGIGHATMHRWVTGPVVLSDGTTLPKGAVVMVRDDKVLDPAVYSNPEEFDAYRYLRLRDQEGEENRYQLVTPSADNMGFGYGTHACPGRFFASNELKIALSFLLLKYDFAFLPGQSRPILRNFEHAHSTPPDVKIQTRRRKEEIDLLQPMAA